MREVFALALLPLPAAAQAVADCDPVPPVTALIEPWEDTTAALAEGALRLAVIEGEEGSRALLVLTLPPVEPTTDPTAPPPPRHCRIVTGEGLGFADIDLSGLESEEADGLLTLRIPALGFLPESTELVPLTLTLGVGTDDSLSVVEEGEPPEAPPEAPPEPSPDAP